MRGQVLGPEVGLDLDDAPDPPPGRIVPDQTGAEQRACRVLGQRRQCGAIQRRGRQRPAQVVGVAPNFG
jgi:hypothetical protein